MTIILALQHLWQYEIKHSPYEIKLLVPTVIKSLFKLLTWKWSYFVVSSMPLDS